MSAGERGAEGVSVDVWEGLGEVAGGVDGADAAGGAGVTGADGATTTGGGGGVRSGRTMMLVLGLLGSTYTGAGA